MFWLLAAAWFALSCAILCSFVADAKRRSRLQLSSVHQVKLAKRRAGPPWVKLSASASASSPAMTPTRRSLRASPKT